MKTKDLRVKKKWTMTITIKINGLLVTWLEIKNILGGDKDGLDPAHG